MEDDIFDESLLSPFSASDRAFLRRLFEKMKSDPTMLNKLSKHIGNCMQKRNTVDFLRLSEELRVQACFEYIIIGLLSGDVKKADVEKYVS